MCVVFKIRLHLFDRYKTKTCGNSLKTRYRIAFNSTSGISVDVDKTNSSQIPQSRMLNEICLGYPRVVLCIFTIILAWCVQLVIHLWPPQRPVRTYTILHSCKASISSLNKCNCEKAEKRGNYNAYFFPLQLDWCNWIGRMRQATSGTSIPRLVLSGCPG